MKGASDYCLINTETECPHLLPHIRSKYVGDPHTQTWISEALLYTMSSKEQTHRTVNFKNVQLYLFSESIKSYKLKAAYVNIYCFSNSLPMSFHNNAR